MYTLETINIELQKYCKYMNCNLPPVVHLKHTEPNDYKAKFIPDTPKQGEYTIELTPFFYNQDIQNQEATLWHEFTHLYDWYYNDIDDSDKTIFLYSYSEAHATEIQYRKLLGLNTRQTIGKEIRSLKDTSKKSYKTLCASYLNNAKIAFEKFQVNKATDSLTNFMRILSYYCGCCLIYNNTYRSAFIDSLKYISDEHEQFLIDYANAISSRNIKNIRVARDELIKRIMFYDIMSKN